ncbi:MAG: OsmC family peroxiredoxin [Bacteroidetes bacterium]|nr:MAG: OsmC family peroxiredoxin [Bacteroidota bacterium]
MSEQNSCSMPMQVKIHGKSESATRINVSAGKFNLIIDEPEQMGGSNLGPTPVQVLLMALAGCLNVTAHEVAKQQNLGLKSLNIEIEGDLDACTFMGCNDVNRAGFEAIKVNMNAQFEKMQMQETIDNWLAETERRCPVTDNIRSLTNIELQLN